MSQYSIKNKNNVNTQNIIVSSKNYVLEEDYIYNLQLAYPIEIPSVGRTYIYLQKAYFDSKDIQPFYTDFLYIYVRGMSLYNKIVSTNENDMYNLIATVPVIGEEEQFYVGDIDSEIKQEIYDNTIIGNITFEIKNQDGIRVKFQNHKPILQFAITTDYSEKVYDSGKLLVEQKYQS